MNRSSIFIVSNRKYKLSIPHLMDIFRRKTKTNCKRIKMERVIYFGDKKTNIQILHILQRKREREKEVRDSES